MQVIIGDQLTCKTIRGAKRWKLPEVDPKDKLTWACEIPGKRNSIFIHVLAKNGSIIIIP